MADGGTIFVEKLKVAELKKELADRGLSTKGVKSELVSRLEIYLEQGVAIQKDSLDESIQDENEEENGTNAVDEVKQDEVAEVMLQKEGKKDAMEEEVPLETSGQPTTEEIPEEKVKPDHKKVTVAPGSGLTKAASEVEKKMERIKRFGGVPSETDKKLQRAQRFGTEHTENAANAKAISKSSVVEQSLDIDKLRKRAERFGAVSPMMSKIEESDRLKKRKERFGIATTGLVTQGLDAKKQKRAERFGL